MSTRSGSRAGNPLGDILFNFFVAKVMREVCAAVEALGFVFRVPDCDLGGFDALRARVSGSLCDLFESLYADDAIFYIAHTSARELVLRIARVAETAATIFTSHGLRVNFAKG